MEDPWTGNSDAMQIDNSGSPTKSGSGSPLNRVLPSLDWAFQVSNPERLEYIPKDGLFKLLRLGNISPETSNQIFNIAISDEERITKDDLYLTLQLLSLAQKRRPVSLDEVALATGEGVDLSPRFEGLNTVVAPSSRSLNEIQGNRPIGVTSSIVAPSVSSSTTSGNRFPSATDITSGDPWGSSSNNAAKAGASGGPTPFVPSNRPKPPYLSDSQSSSSSELHWFLERNKIKVTLLAEKGGVVFKHQNYGVESPAHQSSVIRRYSDFAWLYEVLAKRYPFRLIPPLPPKKISVGNDDIFIEQRRKGLVRFINYVGNHQVLRNDEAVIDFLKVQMELQTYKKTSNSSSEEEFIMYRDTWGSLATSIPSNIDEKLSTIRASLPFLKSQYGNWLNALKSLSNSNAETAKQILSLGEITDSLKENCWMNDCGPCDSIRTGFVSVNRHLTKSILESEEVHDKFSAYLDLIVGFSDLLERFDKLVVSDLDTYNKRINTNQQKLEKLTGAGAASRDFEKISQQIEQDQRDISFHLERNQFAKYCLWIEAQYFHRHKSIISLLFQTFTRCERTFYSNLYEEFDRLQRQVSEMADSGF